MKTFSLGAAALFVILLAAHSYAADAPASQPTTTASTINASDTTALKDAAGKKVTVKGEVSGTFTPSSKSVLLLNFKDAVRGFSVAIKKADLEAVNAGFSGDIGAALKGKTILVTGEIKIYRDKPEIEVSKPEQIQLETK